MRILVTGASGFLGTNLLNHLKSRKDLSIIPFQGSILERADLEKAFQDPPDTVIHLAAKVGAIASFDAPALYARINLEGTANILAYSRLCGVRRFIQMSTIEVYDSSSTACEDSPIRPESPYAVSKAAADFLVLGARDMKALVIRAPSIYGPHDRPGKMIPLFISSVLRGEPIRIYGSGLQERDWIHASDVARAIGLLIREGLPGQVYNLGTGRIWPNLFVALNILSLLNAKSHPILHVPDKPGHGRLHAAESPKIRALGFSPKIDFQAGLKSVVEWYRLKFMETSAMPPP